MGWLKAIGESNIIRDTNQLANTAINLQQLQGQAQHMRALEANQAAEMESQNRYRDVQMAEQKMKNDQMQREMEARQKPIDITVTPQFMSLPPDHQPKVLEFFRTNGLVNERGVGTQESIARGLGIIESSDKLFRSYMLPVVEAKKGTVTQAYNNLLTVKASGDPKKLAMAQAEYEKAYNDYQTASGNFEKHHETLLKGRQQVEAAQVKQTGDMQKIDRQGEWRMKAKGAGGGGRSSDGGGGKGKGSQVYAGIWKATLDDGTVVDIQKNKAGQFIDIQGNPAPKNIVSVTQAVGTKPAGGRGRLSGTTAPATQPAQGGKKVVGEGVYLGRKVVKYSDGSVDYAK